MATSTDHANDGAPVTAWLRQQGGSVRSLLLRSVVCGLLQALLVCVGAWLLAYVLTRAIFAHQTLATLWPALAGIAALAIARSALRLAQRRASDAAGQQVVRQVHRQLQQRVRALGPAWTQRQSSGDMVTRWIDGVDALAPYYTGYLPQTALAVGVPGVVLFAVLSADPWSALVLAVTAPLIPVFMVLVGRAARQASALRWLRLRRLSARFMDALAGLTTLRLYRAAEREQQRLAAASEAYRRETMGVLRIAFLSALVLEFFATVSIALVAVLIGFRLMHGSLDFQAGLFALLLAPEFFLPLRNLGSQRHQRMEAAAAAEGLLELLDQPITTTSCASAFAPCGAHAAPTQPVSICFEDVHFAHADGREALRGVDLVVPAGSRLTVVGPSGSGKSTLLQLVMAMAQPDRGCIRLNGLDLRAVDPEAWRRQIMWISQRPHVFHGSLRDNLLLAQPDADAAALASAVGFAALEPVLARLPRGLDTPLGERGLGLSGGEIQRLAVARAWLRNAPVLLLDEPTQHLDAENAAKIDDALAALGEGRTVIRIAHRLTGLNDHECVAVLIDGRVVEQGRAGALRAAGGAFAALSRADRIR